MIYQVRQNKALVFQLQPRDSLGNGVGAQSLSATVSATNAGYIATNGVPYQFVLVSKNPTGSQGVVVNVTGLDINGNAFSPFPIQATLQGQNLGQSTIEVQGAPQEIDISAAPPDPGNAQITIPTQ